MSMPYSVSNPGLTPPEGWRPIEEAPKDGSIQIVYTAAYEDLPAFISECAWHPDAGWCTCELRVVTHFLAEDETNGPG
jgi:hypothetical protein